MGHRRGWIIPTPLLVSAGIASMAFVEPQQAGWLFAICFVITLRSSTQDIATDGYAVRHLAGKSRPIGNHEPVQTNRATSVLSVMKNLAHSGMTMMCVTHEMGFAREVADRVWFLDGGVLLEDATPETFFTNPQHPRAQKFLADICH